MTFAANSTAFVPAGWHTVTPRIIVRDAVGPWQRAVHAGARSLQAPLDLPYGDRRGMVKDPWENIWQIATRRAAQAASPAVFP
jgi:uncharacterized glyoxalase superfamily protein PhnB